MRDLVVGPLLTDFARQFPGITFDLDLSPRNIDLVGDDVDVAIRLGTVKNEKLVTRRIGSVDQRLFASPTYLTLRGRPTEPADLVGHECILRRGAQRQAWLLQGDTDAAEVNVRGRFMVNNVGLMRVLAERSMGIAVLDPSLVREALATGKLLQVLPEWAAPRLPMHAVMSSRLQPASVRALIDFLAARLAAV
jgi:DNA-binding transcriptional LysR family regulator